MTFYLFAIVGNWGQDGSQGLESHRDVKEVSSKKKVVIVSKHGHGHIPGQVQEGLSGSKSDKMCQTPQ